MNWWKKNRLEDRFSAICYSDDGTSGGAGDTGGGGGGDEGGSDDGGDYDGPEIAEESQHAFGTTYSTPEEATHVQNILAKESDPTHTLSLAEIQAMLSLNVPLGKKPQPKAAPAAAAAPAAKPPVVGAPAAAAPVEAPKPLTASDLVEALKAAAQPAAVAPAATPAAQGPKAFYGEGGVAPAMTVAPELFNQIFNAESPEKAYEGMNQLVNAMMNKVMEDNAALLRHAMKNMTTHIPEAVAVQTRGRENTQKFYSKFPELNKPIFAKTINDAANAIIAQKAKQGQKVDFDDALFDEVGTAVHKFIEQSMGVAIPRAGSKAPVVANAPGKAPAKKAKFFTPGASRPPAEPGKANGKSADLRDLVI